MAADPTKWPDVKYLVYQHEIGENGTHHLQGFVRFVKKKRLTQLKKLEKTIHWEQRRGTEEEAI